MEIIYTCEKCGEKFSSKEECLEHEEFCGNLITFTCDKCGKTIEWKDNSENAFIYENQCHRIILGRMGYGSMLDGSDVNFNLCDECLCQYIESFKNKDIIYNSGSNFYYEDNLS